MTGSRTAVRSAMGLGGGRGHRAAAPVLLFVLSACATAGPAPENPFPRAKPLVLSRAACASGEEDIDRDGLGDACEWRLASFFAPIMVAAPDDCTSGGELPGGGYFHGAQPYGGGVRLVYLPAYFVDCGWSGAKCSLPGVDCSPHAGDSEFLALDVAPRADGAWTVERVFLSAHCFGRSHGDCRWYDGAGLEAFEWAGDEAAGPPVIWVSEGRHANYPSRSACDGGHWSIDTCDRHRVGRRYPMHPARNVGSSEVQIADGVPPPGCVRGAALEASGRVVTDAVECFWTALPFRGWQEEGAGSTPYVRYLTEIAGY